MEMHTLSIYSIIGRRKPKLNGLIEQESGFIFLLNRKHSDALVHGAHIGSHCIQISAAALCDSDETEEWISPQIILI